MDKMKILIVSDLEGVVGVYDLIDPEMYSELYNNEIHVIIDTLISLGINDITVCDVHDNGDTINESYLNKKGIKFVSKFWNIDTAINYDMAFLTGFHGMNNSVGYFPHTLRNDILSLEIRGLFSIGEVELFMRWLSYHNIPVTLVIGDSAAVWEANRTDPKVTPCMVKDIRLKDDISITNGYKRITEGVRKAITSNSSSLAPCINNALYLKLINSDFYSEMSGAWKITKEGLFFNSYDELVFSMGQLCKELNRIDQIVISRSRAFIHKVRPYLKSHKKGELMDSTIGPILRKDLITLTKEDQDIVNNYINTHLECLHENN